MVKIKCRMCGVEVAETQDKIASSVLIFCNYWCLDRYECDHLEL